MPRPTLRCCLLVSFLALCAAGLHRAAAHHRPAQPPGAPTATPAPSTAPATPAATPALEMYKPVAGPFTVKVIDEDWRDAARDRTLPVRIYMPQRPAGAQARPSAPPEKFPVIVFSHGLWGSRMNYGYFGQHMASHGYLVVAPTHPGSDTADLLRRTLAAKGSKGSGEKGAAAGASGWLMESIEDPDNLRQRPLDLTFVIDEIARNAQLGAIADMSRVGVGGHSFGAYTVMAIGGMKVDLPNDKGHSFRDERVKAVLPMSPEGTGTMGIRDGAWDAFAAPVMFLTGTRDYGAGARSAAWRRTAFDAVNTVDDYLVTLNGAGHMTFGTGGGKGGDGSPAQDAARERLIDRLFDRMQEKNGGKPDDKPLSPAGAAGGAGKPGDQAHHTMMINSLSAAFFDAYLNNDPAARTWLAAYFAAKHDDCTAEFKAGKSP